MLPHCSIALIPFISVGANKDMSDFWFGFVWVQLPELDSF